MKKLILKSLLSSLIVSAFFAVAYSAEPSAPPHPVALTKLKNLKVNELKTVDENTTLNEKEMRAQDEVFDALEDAVNASLKDPSNMELQAEILNVTIVMLKKDPTQFAAEVILPYYEKNRKGFDSSVKKLSPENAKMVKEAVKSAAREKKKGNG
ncbi:MAG: phosphoenolpyruvate carboxylase [Bdellovibrio sp.]